MVRSRLSLGVVACIAACSRSGDVATTAAPSAEEVMAAAPEHAFSELHAPGDVLAYGGVRSLGRVLDRLESALGPFVAPGTLPPRGAAERGLAAALHLTSPAALDVDKGARLAWFDGGGAAPEALPDLAFIIGIASPAAFAAALPATRERGAFGNAYALGDTDLVYVNFVDDFAVLTSRPASFRNHDRFLAELVSAALPTDMVCSVRLAAAIRAYPSAFDTIFERMAENAGEEDDADPDDGGPFSRSDTAAWFQRGLRQIDEALLTFHIEDGIGMGLRLVPRAGSEAALGFAALAGRPASQLLGRFPADSSFFITTSEDPEKPSLIVGTLLRAMAKVLPPGAAEAWRDSAPEFVRASTGEGIVVGHTAQGEVAISTVMGVRDAATMRRAGRALAGAKQQAEGRALDMPKTALTLGAFTVGGIPVDAARIIAPTAGSKRPPGWETTYAAVGNEFALMTFGPGGHAAIEGLLGGTLPGGLDRAPGVVRAFTRAPAPPIAMFYFDAGALLRLLGRAPPRTGAPPREPAPGVSFSASVRDGALHLVFDIPAEQMPALMRFAPDAPKGPSRSPLKL